MKPNIYNFLDIKKDRVCYVGKHNGADKSYLTGSKILLRYKKMFGKVAFNNRFKKQIIEYCESELLNDREVYWIKIYNTYKEGLNLTKGGDYDWKYKVRKSKEVLKYDLNGNYIDSYKGAVQAALQNGLCRTAVSDCITGSQMSSGGFIWKLCENDHKPVKIDPYCKNGYKKDRESNSRLWIEYSGTLYPSVAKLAKHVTGKRDGLIPLSIVNECRLYQRVIIELVSGLQFNTIDEASAHFKLKRSTIQSKIVKGLPVKDLTFMYHLKEIPVESVLNLTSQLIKTK